MKFLHNLRRTLHRIFAGGPALLREMGVEFSKVPPHHRGFVIIQIDGLSHGRLLRAMRSRAMPFVRGLVKSNKYKVHGYLSEIPTSTPAFQGGLFYGNNDEIPGFQFYDKRNHRYYKMGYTECAYEIEQGFKNGGLLRDGTILSGVFSGGAEANLFVFSTMMAPSRWRFALRLWDFLVLTAVNVTVIIRILFMLVEELLLGAVDAIRFIITRRVIRRQFQFIGARLAISVIAREVNTMGAVVDIYRRVPYIYANYLGYDEHAHMRGPDSAVAMWTLRGIDKDIRRIHNAIKYSGRKYDLFIISDHGQSAVTPFEIASGEPLAEFIQSEVSGLLVESYAAKEQKTAQMLRSVDALNQLSRTMPRFFRPMLRLYGKYLTKRVTDSPEVTDLDSLLDVVVTSTGPIAYVYWNDIPEPLDAEEVEARHPGLIDHLAAHKAVGCISLRTRDGSVLIKAGAGELRVDKHGNEVQTGVLPLDFSVERAHVVRGICRITRMRRAGDICIWGDGSPSGDISYSFEFGAHSGYGDNQLSSFVVAPAHITEDFSRIRYHAEFYQFFMKYRADSSPAGEGIPADHLPSDAEAEK